MGGLEELDTWTKLHSDLLDESLSCLTPPENTLIAAPLEARGKSQFRIWSMSRRAALQALTSGTAESDSIILFVTLTAASRAQQ